MHRIWLLFLFSYFECEFIAAIEFERERKYFCEKKSRTRRIYSLYGYEILNDIAKSTKLMLESFLLLLFAAANAGCAPFLYDFYLLYYYSAAYTSIHIQYLWKYIDFRIYYFLCFFLLLFYWSNAERTTSIHIYQLMLYASYV